MAVSVAALIRRRERLDARIREAEEQAKAAEQFRRNTEQARHILGGLIMVQDRISDTMRALLTDHASRRRLSDQGGWQVIAARWDILLPELAVPAAPPSAVAPTATPEVEALHAQ